MGEKANRAFITYFLRGGMRLSGLLPAAYLEEDAVLTPAITAPSSIVTCEVSPAFRDTKGGKIEIHSHFNLLRKERQHCPDCRNKLEPLSKFLQLGEEVLTLKTRQREEAHIQIDPKSQRVAEGDLYEYITLEAGQWFVGELDCDANYWQPLQSLTGLKVGEICPVRVGKATRRGYGLLHLILLDMDESEPSPWITKPITARISESDIQENSLTFSLLLLTDAIVTDKWGRYSAGFASSWLAKVLGLHVKQVQIEKQFVKQQPQDGFNTHRRMPRWRDQTIAAGSVAQVTLTGVNKDVLSQLADLEREGIGLRRHEGFGRIAINHPLLENSPSFDYRLADEDTWEKVIDNLRPDLRAHQLQTNSFISRWTRELEKQRSVWDEMNVAEYEALARLIFLYRHRPINELLTWLAEEPVVPDDPKDERTRLVLGQPRHLWGNKSLEGREQEVRLSKEAMQAIRRLVQALAEEKPEYHALGLEMLAETIATHVRENLR
jgi:CRISPR-associated protein Csx10